MVSAGNACVLRCELDVLVAKSTKVGCLSYYLGSSLSSTSRYADDAVASGKEGKMFV